ncbi:MAG: hypothetical protein MRY83_08935 [Flavobacteriales bacterium]|nr:hypothetical protein [Flavobacteriales bacterium]
MIKTSVIEDILEGDKKTSERLKADEISALFRIKSMSYEFKIPVPWDLEKTGGHLVSNDTIPQLIVDTGENNFAEIHFSKRKSNYNFQYNVQSLEEPISSHQYGEYLLRNRHVHSVNIIIDQINLGNEQFYYCFDEMQIGFHRTSNQFHPSSPPAIPVYSLLLYKVFGKKNLQFKYVYFQQEEIPDFSGMKMMVSILKSVNKI